MFSWGDRVPWVILVSWCARDCPVWALVSIFRRRWSPSSAMSQDGWAWWLGIVVCASFGGANRMGGPPRPQGCLSRRYFLSLRSSFCFQACVCARVQFSLVRFLRLTRQLRSPSFVLCCCRCLERQVTTVPTLAARTTKSARPHHWVHSLFVQYHREAALLPDCSAIAVGRHQCGVCGQLSNPPQSEVRNVFDCTARPSPNRGRASVFVLVLQRTRGQNPSCPKPQLVRKLQWWIC